MKKYFTTQFLVFKINNFISSVSRRSLILFIIPLFFTTIILGIISYKSINRNDIFIQQPQNIQNKQRLDLVYYFDQLSKLVKIPFSFLTFYVYSQNSVQATNVDGSRQNTFLNIDVLGIYTDGIQTGKMRRVYGPVNIVNFTGTPISTSFRVSNASTTIPLNDHAYYYIFLIPTFISFLVLWISLVFVWYGLIVIFGLWLKFLLFGSPIKEIIDDFTELKQIPFCYNTSMKTKFILHGGFTPGNQNENNSDFYKEILKDAHEGTKVLIVPFAKDVERIPLTTERVKNEFNKNKQQEKLEFEVANEEFFIKQVNSADVIYFQGGTSLKLLDVLKKFPELKDSLTGKIIAGESAGANVLGEFFFSPSANKVFEGLGILPIKIIPHYKEEYKHKLDEFGTNLEEVHLPEYTHKVFSI
ncbi:MAG: hypothetical protein CEO12_361 [Parcubacteria group bacterium Gr01-1014_46]|nr:MAG: hypothetical protein CEO12_361 [Parcubacteria group bacterium Gr01-1014_46]